jgi:hypothetical protein
MNSRHIAPRWEQVQNTVATKCETSPAPRSRVDESFTRLRVSLTRLETAVELLQRRLEPARGAYSPQPSRNQEDCHGTPCPISNEIDDAEARVYTLADSIEAEIYALSI